MLSLVSLTNQTVFKYETPWGRSFFEVFGSKGRYSVSVDLPAPVSTYCACPAFAFSVLLSDIHAMVGKLVTTCQQVG
jgi:zinc finger SWIM domain-containing protein 7